PALRTKQSVDELFVAMERDGMCAVANGEPQRLVQGRHCPRAIQRYVYVSSYVLLVAFAHFDSRDNHCLRLLSVAAGRLRQHDCFDTVDSGLVKDMLSFVAVSQH